jgi:ADP-heptose:LPS heptosyltransferase
MKRRKGKAPKCLICRFGGIGDSIAPITVLAREWKRRNPGGKVHFAVRAEIASLFDHEKLFDKILPIKRMEPTKLDCIHRDGGWISLECIKDKYDIVFDLKYSVELNSPYQELAQRDGPWRTSMNSNFTNWVELTLAWANIDPTTVEDFKPSYVATNEELAWAAKRVPEKKGQPVIGIHLQASSLARTWYRADELPDRLRTLMPDARILFFEEATKHWILSEKVGGKRIDVSGDDGLRKSAALLTRMDLFICADSGYSHIAAALDCPTLTIYTTVPGWTREKYYEHATPIQSKLSCSPCFTLEGWCPRQAQRAKEQLTKREQRILEYEGRPNFTPQQAAKEEKMPPQAFMALFAATKQKLQSMCTVEPDCMKEITPEMVAERAEELLNEA